MKTKLPFLGTILPTEDSERIGDKVFQSNQKQIDMKINQLNLNHFPMTVVAGEKRFHINDTSYCIISSRDHSILFFERRDSNPDHWWSVKPGTESHKKLLEIVKKSLASFSQ